MESFLWRYSSVATEIISYSTSRVAILNNRMIDDLRTASNLLYALVRACQNTRVFDLNTSITFLIACREIYHLLILQPVDGYTRPLLRYMRYMVYY